MKNKFTSIEMIEGFISEYIHSRVAVETTIRSICKRALEYEQTIHKSFTDFTVEEILKFYKNANAISVTSLQNTNLVLKHACSWINFTKGETRGNNYEIITKNMLKDCVVKRDFISRDQLYEIENNLLNFTDRAIIKLLFEGVGGRWCSELTYLDPNQVSKEDMRIYFRTGKNITINNVFYKLLQDAFNETELISYSATMKVTHVSGNGLYKVRNNTIHSNNDPRNENDMERRFRYIQRRLTIIGNYIDIKLTASTLQESGLYHYIHDGMTTTGLNFRQFIHTVEAKQLARRFDIYTNLYPQVLVDKFEEYFK